MAAVPVQGKDARATEHYHVNGWLLRPGHYTVEAAAHGASATAEIDVYKVAQDALEANPDLAGILAINDLSALGAYSALEKASKTDQVKIIGYDGQPEGKQAIKEGKIYADPIQYPERIGVETVQAIVRYFRGEPPAPEILIPTGLYRKADAEKDKTLQ